jgi:hypothetical protein
VPVAELIAQVEHADYRASPIKPESVAVVGDSVNDAPAPTSGWQWCPAPTSHSAPRMQ